VPVSVPNEEHSDRQRQLDDAEIARAEHPGEVRKCGEDAQLADGLGAEQRQIPHDKAASPESINLHVDPCLDLGHGLAA
jgi:hypothetical protein